MGLVNRVRDSTKKHIRQTQRKRDAIQTQARFLEITFLEIMDESKKMLKLLLPPSHFVCPLFHFEMSQNIVLFLKIKVINLLMFLLYPY